MGARSVVHAIPWFLQIPGSHTLISCCVSQLGLFASDKSRATSPSEPSEKELAGTASAWKSGVPLLMVPCATSVSPVLWFRVEHTKPFIGLDQCPRPLEVSLQGHSAAHWTVDRVQGLTG